MDGRSPARLMSRDASTPPVDLRKGSYGWILAAILTAGFLARLGLAVWIPTRPISDFLGYYRSAESLAETGRYEVAPGIPTHSHPPAYPLVISLGLRLAPAGEGLYSAKLINALLGCLAAFFGAALARGLWGEAAGIWTAGGLALLPRSLLMADLIASENLFAPLLMLFLVLCARSWTRKPSPALAAEVGLVVGALALTRSVAYLLVVVWVVGALAARWRLRELALGAVLLLVSQHALMLPWAIHNARVLGRCTFLNSVGGVGLFIGNNPRATGEWQPWNDDLERLRPGVLARGPLAIDDAARQEAWRWILAHPARALSLYARKLRIILSADYDMASFSIFGVELSPPPPRAVLPAPHPLKSHPRLVHGILRASGLLVALTAGGGLLLLMRSAREGSITSRAMAVGLTAAALYVPIVSAAIAVSGRYRWPSEDVVMPLAGLFLARLRGGPTSIGEKGKPGTSA